MSGLNPVPPTGIGLYIHMPWCVKKCPYCDFNSHALRGNIDEQAYIDSVLNDTAMESAREDETRIVTSIFIGGGTPSLFSGEAIQTVLDGIRRLLTLDPVAEITLEANPGAVDESHFHGYRHAGVNRMSIGVQSFNPDHLQALGRVHDPAQACKAVVIARDAGFDNINLDLMYCLPGQSVQQAIVDAKQAMELNPTHISAYQLTIEPNTLFALRPPSLPDEGLGWDIQQGVWAALEQGGYRQYEISAWARPGHECRHNLNYWRFGDYLGIGAGAHGKLTFADGVYRTTRPKHPNEYLRYFSSPDKATTQLFDKKVSNADLPLEYMMNNLRLGEGFSLEEFETSTGVGREQITTRLDAAIDRGLLDEAAGRYRPSNKGKLFLDNLLQDFLPDKENVVCCG